MKTKEFFLVSYLPHDVLQDILDTKLKQIDKYAYILHDKDVYDKDVVNDVGDVLHCVGEIKAPHTHIYLRLFESRDSGEIQRWFTREIDGQRVNCFYERVHNRIGCIAYLTHRTKKAQHKYQYDLDSIVSFNLDGSELDGDCVDNSLDILDDMMSGVPLREMIRRYGKQFIYQYKTYREMMIMLLKSQNDEIIKKGEINND